MRDKRPKFSVLIPTYRPDATLLRQALLSVLNQDRGPEAMEIAVVDDASPDRRPDDIVRGVGGGRIGMYRQARNLGLARNWNACIGRARGEWIHLLHQDDRVRPGFYSALERGLYSPDVAIAFCRHSFLDSADKIVGQSDLERESPGVIPDFLMRIASGQRIQFAAALLRRSACIAAGGFNESLVFALDWEMWVRLASRHAVWFEPRILACYRVHEKSAGWELARAGVMVRDHVRTIESIVSYMPPDERQKVRRLSRQSAARYGLDTASRLIDHGAIREGIACGLECLLISPTREQVSHFVRVVRQAVSRLIQTSRAARTSRTKSHVATRQR
jgi:glycosyltransferase involved in cell wall biosynthesis